MARLTNEELYKYAGVKYDKSNSPHVQKKAFVWLYSQARLNWLRFKFKDFEVTNIARSDLRQFIRDFDFGDVRRVIIPDSLNVEFVAGVYADFEFFCNGNTNLRTRPIIPFTADGGVESGSDPYWQPNDEFPSYMERNNGQEWYLDILSTNTPKGVAVFFCKKPKPFDLLENPTGFTEEDEKQQYDILDMAVRDYDAIIENYNQYQARDKQVQENG